MRAPHQKLQRHIAWAVILAESTHVFCCVLPTVVTVLTVISSLGAMAQVPGFILDMHEVLHTYEIPMIVFSGLVLILGWGLYGVSRQIECQKPHCEPHARICTPQKNNTLSILVVASILFVVNVTVYLTLHRGNDDLLHAEAMAHHHPHAGHRHP